MIDLYLQHHHRLDNGSYDDYGNIIPKWEFLDETVNTTDLDLCIIRFMYKENWNIEVIKQFSLDNHRVIISDKGIIFYELNNTFRYYTKSDLDCKGLLNLLLRDVEVSEGIELQEQYDIINGNIVFKKLELSLQDMFKIVNNICLAKEQDITIGTGEVFHLSYGKEYCTINKVKIPTIDTVILNFLFQTKVNLLDLKTFTIDASTFVLGGNNLIRYSCLDDIDYVDLDCCEYSELLEFIEDTKIIEKVESKKDKKQRSRKEKEEQKKEDIHKENSILQSIKEKLLFLIKSK